MVIKRVDPLSAAKVVGTLYAAIGLIVGAIVSMVALAGGLAADTTRAAGAGAMLGAGAIIAVPLFYGGIGFVGTMVAAALYNVVANMIGGIEMDVE